MPPADTVIFSTACKYTYAWTIRQCAFPQMEILRDGDEWFGVSAAYGIAYALPAVEFTKIISSDYRVMRMNPTQENLRILLSKPFYHVISAS